jgi:hypothetical protein
VQREGKESFVLNLVSGTLVVLEYEQPGSEVIGSVRFMWMYVIGRLESHLLGGQLKRLSCVLWND